MPKKILANTAKNNIIIRGARVNNLKNVDIDIPKYKFIVFTGVSGSGKSSLVFDTVYAEGQRRYVESLSAYARQFLEKMNKPDADVIEGLAPSMAIEQKTGIRNSRSTVGTATEIYDYLRLLFARIGIIYSPVSGEPVEKDSPDSIVKFFKKFSSGVLYIYIKKIFSGKDNFQKIVTTQKEKGFSKIIIGNGLIDLHEFNDEELLEKIESGEINLLIDIINFRKDNEESVSRFFEALESAFKEGDGYLYVRHLKDDNFKDYSFSLFLEKDGITFEAPEPRLFSFNNPYGACKKCQGFSKTMDINYDLVIPDKGKSILQNAILPYSTPKHSKHLNDLVVESTRNKIDLYKPFRNLTRQELDFVYKGGGRYMGLYKFFKYIDNEARYKIHYRILQNKYRGYTVCSECEGSRLRSEALYIKVGGKNIHAIVQMKIREAYEFFDELKLNSNQKQIAERILNEIKSRLKYLVDVGLTYLTLDRVSFTLSGGETQRINLSTSLGSALVGSIYVLDEPTVGLHPIDNEKLIKIIKSLRDIGNTVLVVEHDKDMMAEADMIVDMGPLAGELGGEVVFKGNYKEILKSNKSLTGKYLSGKEKVPERYYKTEFKFSKHYIEITGARENNLKDINIKIPLKEFTCITGVSGSGKSTLMHTILYSGLRKKLEGAGGLQIGEHDSITGYESIDFVELIDQNSIGKTSRSNPVTYIKAFDEIRDAFAQTSQSKKHGYTSGYFSFNVPGGRCEECEGTGTVKIEMQFMSDIYLECESCSGKRYKTSTLDVKLKGADGSYKNITEVLNMTVNEAMLFFSPFPKVIKKLKYLEDVGLGYIKLGQSGTTLSGGEAQRVKLAYHLAFQESLKNTLFIFDEPTTGLHIHDISKLLKCFDALVKRGNTIVVIEHNLDVIKYADYIIDLGPGSGDDGGYVVATGSPMEIAKNSKSVTGKFLKKMII